MTGEVRSLPVAGANRPRPDPHGHAAWANDGLSRAPFEDEDELEA
jgi:hypothetical protein